MLSVVVPKMLLNLTITFAWVGDRLVSSNLYNKELHAWQEWLNIGVGLRYLTSDWGFLQARPYVIRAPQFKNDPSFVFGNSLKNDIFDDYFI